VLSSISHVLYTAWYAASAVAACAALQVRTDSRWSCKVTRQRPLSPATYVIRSASLQLAMASTVQAAPAAQLAAAAWFYLGLSSERLGPFSQAAVIDLISKGTLDPNALAWTEGQGEWQPIASLPPFRDAAEVRNNFHCVSFCVREARSYHSCIAPPCLVA
jgi:GYF domain 2